MLIIGITGQPSSGKDTVAEYLASKGFAHVSSSDKIREEMRKVGLTTERENVSNFVIEKRKERGNGYLAEQISDAIIGDTVVSGLRNTAEIEIFRKRFGKEFLLIAVDAPIETRFRWAKDRGRIGDNISFEQFKKEEEKERAGSSFHEVDHVIKLADHLIFNDGTKEELLKKVDSCLR